MAARRGLLRLASACRVVGGDALLACAFGAQAIIDILHAFDTASHLGCPIDLALVRHFAFQRYPAIECIDVDLATYKKAPSFSETEILVAMGGKVTLRLRGDK